MTEAREHLNELDIATYLGHRMPRSERDLVEDHLAQCDACREAVVETRRLAGGRFGGRKIAVPLAIAAAASVLVLVIPGRERPVTRELAAPMPLASYSPTGTVLRNGLRFIWGSAENADIYRVSLSTPDGSLLWSDEGTDTVAVLPDSVSLVPGTALVWFADAVLKDGTQRSTGVHRITLK